jgi:hypothetical protein
MDVTTLAIDSWFCLGLAITLSALLFAPAKYWCSHVVLYGLATATASQDGCPIGWMGLLHHIVLFDLAGLGLAVATSASLPLPATPSETAAGSTSHSLLPQRLEQRAGAMFALLCVVLAWIMLAGNAIFQLPPWLGWWAAMSELLAATVIWKIAAAWLKTCRQGKPSWQFRTGVMVVAISGTLALLLIPIILAAADNLR